MHEPAEREPEPLETLAVDSKKPCPRLWQVSLRTLFLLIAAIAVWLTYAINRRHNAALDARIRSMYPMAHELVVDDPKQFAAVKLEEYVYDQKHWDVYVPAGRYRLCFATRDIDINGMPKISKSVALEPGRHRLALAQAHTEDHWSFGVTRDGKTFLSLDEKKDWEPGNGSSTAGGFSISEQLPTEKPLVLMRRRYMTPSNGGQSYGVPNGPTNGLMLWIERTVDEKLKSQ